MMYGMLGCQRCRLAQGAKGLWRIPEANIGARGWILQHKGALGSVDPVDRVLGKAEEIVDALCKPLVAQRLPKHPQLEAVCLAPALNRLVTQIKIGEQLIRLE